MSKKNSFSFNGIDEYANKIVELSKASTGQIKKAIYEGAKIALDDMRAEVESLPVEPSNQYSKNIVGLTPPQKQGLLDGLGATTMQNKDGVIYTQIGFSGYNSTKTKKFPKGQPNALIARSLLKGTSFRKRNKFVDRVIAKCKAKSEKAMADSLENSLRKITK